MPPLAHLLAPQIMAKAREIEAALGPPKVPQIELGPAEVTRAPQVELGPAEVRRAPQIELGPAEVTRAPKGYLAQQTSVGFEKTPYDPRGVVNKPEEDKFFDPRTPEGATGSMLGYLQRSGDPRLQDVARAFIAGQQGAMNTARTAQGHMTPQLLPNAPIPGAARGEQIGMTESGEPIYQAPDKKKKLALKKGEAAGFNEKGESVDPKGKKLGYLAAPTFGDGHPLRDLARRKDDITISPRTGELARTDAFAQDALKQLFGKHLKAVQENFDETGKETFPAGYLDKMSPTERKNVKDGVKALKLLNKGDSA